MPDYPSLGERLELALSITLSRESQRRGTTIPGPTTAAFLEEASEVLAWIDANNRENTDG